MGFRLIHMDQQSSKQPRYFKNVNIMKDEKKKAGNCSKLKVT